jgi:hypothetical protein
MDGCVGSGGQVGVGDGRHEGPIALAVQGDDLAAIEGGQVDLAADVGGLAGAALADGRAAWSGRTTYRPERHDAGRSPPRLTPSGAMFVLLFASEERTTRPGPCVPA